jgi:hypothetical protein
MWLELAQRNLARVRVSDQAAGSTDWSIGLAASACQPPTLQDPDDKKPGFDRI